jgi:hypothetical protein
MADSYAAMVSRLDERAAALSVGKRRGVEETRPDVDAAATWPDLAIPGAISTPPIPAETLPGLLGEFAAAVAESTQTPPAASVMCTLSTLATLFQRRFEVAPHNDDYTETLSVWTMCALPSGSRKSAIIGHYTAPLHRYEKLERDRLRSEIARVTAARAVAEERIKKLRADAAKAKDVAERQQIQADIEEVMLGQPSELRAPRLATGNATPERVQSMLAEHGERIAIHSDEAGVLGVLAGQYSGGKADLDVFLQGYSGSPLHVDRQGREAHVDRPAVTMNLMVQPGVLAEICGENRRFRDSGLLARFLYCLPVSNVGLRDVRSRKGVPPDLVQKWADLVIGSLPRDTPQQVTDARVLSLDGKALGRWLDLSEYIERNQGEGGRFEPISDWTAKFPGNVARIAALIELGRTEGAAECVTDDSMVRAVRIGRALIEHAQAAFRMLGADQVEADALALLRWVRAGGVSEFRRSDAQKALEGRFRTVEKLKAAASRLEEWCVLSAERQRKNAGARPTPYYAVNPRLFDESR